MMGVRFNPTQRRLQMADDYFVRRHFGPCMYAPVSQFQSFVAWRNAWLKYLERAEDMCYQYQGVTGGKT